MKLSGEEIKHFKDHGYITNFFFERAECDFYKKHFEKLTKIYSESSYKGKLKDRIMNPHFIDETSRKILLNPNFFLYANQLLNSEVYGVQTMYFEKGSEQKYHQDDFYLNRTIGFWIALDDVDESNGSISLQQESHKYDAISPESLGIKNPQLLEDELRYSNKLFEVYLNNKNNMKLRDKIVNLKKGNGIIFDGRLIHCGLPIINKKKKRRVIVCHYLESNSRWPYINWPLFCENGNHKVNGIFDKNNLHPNKI
ncbi:MAG: phytanoyl-CoA dioxygenase family protein [SAR202 cluster bacterium]|jgi:ectoine hydroxylase-related dioxygenase (phytanoyl-CoA dioxygenase family)|nr:phytanoyl-CoA dioxygenase family protein [SAR202 cluster bacterium]